MHKGGAADRRAALLSRGRRALFDLTAPSVDQLRALAAGLTDDERHLLLDHGEEAPFCGVFLTEKREGLYTCRLCGLPLFRGGAKFESGTGWPSFTAPFAGGHLREVTDTSYFMVRTEIVCARCGAHQGHVYQLGLARIHSQERPAAGPARTWSAGRRGLDGVDPRGRLQ